MFDSEDTYISLSDLATHFGLPRSFLKELADKGLIPSLNVNGRRKFNPATVEKALEKLADQRAESPRRQSLLGGQAHG
jgi:hypothetical protein